MNPFELYDYLAFSGIAVIAFLTGRKTAHPRVPPPLKPVCSCEHGWGMHENGKKCQATDEKSDYDPSVSMDVYRYLQCDCLKYDGPDPALFGLVADES